MAKLTCSERGLDLSEVSSSKRSSSYSSSDSDTELTARIITQGCKMSPNLSSISVSSKNISALEIAASACSPQASGPSPQQYHGSPCVTEPSYLLSRGRRSFDSKDYSPIVYTAGSLTYAHLPYVPSELHYSRQRAALSLKDYSTAPGYPDHRSSYFSSSHDVPHIPPVYRVGDCGSMYSSPPTPQDRRKAHILSEQKRRESINGAFEELKQILNSERVTRALSLSFHESTERDSDSKITFEPNRFFGGGNRDSKWTTLRNAGRALTMLADALNESNVELAMLRKRLGATDCKSIIGNESRPITAVHDLTLRDDEMEVVDSPLPPLL